MQLKFVFVDFRLSGTVLCTSLVVALDSVARKSIKHVAGTEAEAVAQPLDLANTIFDGAVQNVSLTSGHDGVLWLLQEPFAFHHTCSTGRGISSD